MNVFTDEERQAIKDAINRARKDGKTDQDIKKAFCKILAVESQNYCIASISEERIEELKRLAYQDALTGCYNRTKLEELRDRYDKLDLIVAMIDMDGLKNLNDLYGHAEGDAHLITIGKELWKFFERNAFRLGGDEFLVATDWYTREQCEKILAMIPGISYGICTKPSDIALSSAMELADSLLYKRKAEHKRILEEIEIIKSYCAYDCKRLADAQEALLDELRKRKIGE